MTFARTLYVALGLTALFVTTLATPGWAQAPTAPDPAVTPPPAATPAPPVEEGSGVIAFGLVIALLLLLVMLGKLLDLRDKRREEATHVQSLISDALLRDRTLGSLPVTPAARVPLWRGSPVTITLLGQVPTSERRQAVLRLAEQEASRIRSDLRIDDRIAIVPSATSIAA